MKDYLIRGDLKIRGMGDRQGGPFHVGSPDDHSEFIDRRVMLDSFDRPILPGTSLCGVMASLARKLIVNGGYNISERDKAFAALFGSARGDTEGEQGQSSRLKVFDSHVKSESYSAMVRDRNAINRELGSADDKRLFREEVVDGDICFDIKLEFRETGPMTTQELRLQDSGLSPDQMAVSLLHNILKLMENGWAHFGGSIGTGYGRFKLCNCTIRECDRSSPDDVLAYALNGWNAKDKDGKEYFEEKPFAEIRNEDKTAVVELNDNIASEKVRFSCIIRPMEPLLVKTGYSTEVVKNKGAIRSNNDFGLIPLQKEFSVDASFCRDTNEKPYIPGSSIRGTLRSHAERAVRTVVGGDKAKEAAWDVGRAEEEGKLFSNMEKFKESDVSCLVSHLFGFPAMGGRIIFSDAVPLDSKKFNSRLKMLDHVALDRFSGGAADQHKFNSRPFFPSGPPETASDEGDLEFEIEMFDFSEDHLGMLLLLLRDLRMGRILLGYGKNRGFGRVKLQKIAMEALTFRGGLLEGEAFEKARKLGPFKTYQTELSFNEHDYISSLEDNPLNIKFRKAEECFRSIMRNFELQNGDAR